MEKSYNNAQPIKSAFLSWIYVFCCACRL